MQQWEYLVINVYYRDGSDSVIIAVSCNYPRIFSNILKEEFNQYLKKLAEEGWTLEDIHPDAGAHEAYYFKRPIK